MYEVELKVPADLEAVRARLEALEATPTGAVVQVDTYYDAPHRSFPDTDEALRIRRERPAEESEDRAVVTYKGPLVDDESKTREEIETGVESAEALDGVLSNLGFEAVEPVRKERERYELEGYTVTLDAVDGAGEFVEVEREVPESELESARTGARELLERLELDPETGTQTSYLGMVLERSE